MTTQSKRALNNISGTADASLKRRRVVLTTKTIGEQDESLYDEAKEVSFF